MCVYTAEVECSTLTDWHTCTLSVYSFYFIFPSPLHVFELIVSFLYNNINALNYFLMRFLVIQIEPWNTIYHYKALSLWIPLLLTFHLLIVFLERPFKYGKFNNKTFQEMIVSILLSINCNVRHVMKRRLLLRTKILKELYSEVQLIV